MLLESYNQNRPVKKNRISVISLSRPNSVTALSCWTCYMRNKKNSHLFKQLLVGVPVTFLTEKLLISSLRNLDWRLVDHVIFWGECPVYWLSPKRVPTKHLLQLWYCEIQIWAPSPFPCIQLFTSLESPRWVLYANVDWYLQDGVHGHWEDSHGKHRVVIRGLGFSAPPHILHGADRGWRSRWSPGSINPAYLTMPL